MNLSEKFKNAHQITKIWATLFLSILLYSLFVVMMHTLPSIATTTHLPHTNLEFNYHSVPNIISIYCVLLILFFSRYRQPLRKNFAFHIIPARQLIIFNLAIMAASSISLLFPISPEKLLSFYPLFSNLWSNILGQGHEANLIIFLFVLPFFAECIFRGFLFSGLERGLGGMNAVIITAYIWSIPMHVVYLPSTILYFFIGILLGMARLHSNSVWLPYMMNVVSRVFIIVNIHY